MKPKSKLFQKIKHNLLKEQNHLNTLINVFMILQTTGIDILMIAAVAAIVALVFMQKVHQIEL